MWRKIARLLSGGFGREIAVPKSLPITRPYLARL
ncbi:hypothetical protein ABIA45_007613 [Bradyrhizobium sp. USDA 336]